MPLQNQEMILKTPDYICAHRRTECNGCPLMGLEYNEQLALKAREAKLLLGVDVHFERAQHELGYRNKADLAFIDEILGYRRRDNFGKSFRIEYCHILGKKANESAQMASKTLAEYDIKSAEVLARKNGLGYVVVRSSQSGKIMLNFVFFGEVDEKIFLVAENLVNNCICSVNILLNETWSDDAKGKVVKIFGKDNIVEEILGKKFIVHANTFFQTNVQSAQAVFAKAKEFLPPNAKLLDLYCGIGTIGIIFSGNCKSVLGVEIVNESIESAKENALANNVSNCEFVCANVDVKLKEMEKSYKGFFDVCVVDPPRSGLNDKTIRRLLRLEIPRIIYVSCNPKTLAQNIAKLSDYSISFIEGFDQFAQTNHSEILCVLDRKVSGSAAQ